MSAVAVILEAVVMGASVRLTVLLAVWMDRPAVAHVEATGAHTVPRLAAVPSVTVGNTRPLATGMGLASVCATTTLLARGGAGGTTACSAVGGMSAGAGAHVGGRTA